MVPELWANDIENACYDCRGKMEPALPAESLDMVSWTTVFMKTNSMLQSKTPNVFQRIIAKQGMTTDALNLFKLHLEQERKAAYLVVLSIRSDVDLSFAGAILLVS